MYWYTVTLTVCDWFNVRMWTLSCLKACLQKKLLKGTLVIVLMIFNITTHKHNLVKRTGMHVYMKESTPNNNNKTTHRTQSAWSSSHLLRSRDDQGVVPSWQSHSPLAAGPVPSSQQRWCRASLIPGSRTRCVPWIVPHPGFAWSGAHCGEREQNKRCANKTKMTCLAWFKGKR